MQFCKFFSFTLTLALLTQNITYAYADPSSADQSSNDTSISDSSPAIYHIALTPWESHTLGFDNLEAAVPIYEKYQTDKSIAQAMSAVVLLTTAGAFYYFMSPTPQRDFANYVEAHQAFHSAIENPLSNVRLEYPFGDANNYVLTIDNSLTKKLVLAFGAVTLGGTWGSILKEDKDRDRVIAAFNTAQSHANESCHIFDGYRAKTVHHSALQSKHFSEEDFNQGRVYLDGKLLSLEDVYRNTDLNNVQDKIFYVFNTDIQCKTGYLTSTPLSVLIAATR